MHFVDVSVVSDCCRY